MVDNGIGKIIQRQEEVRQKRGTRGKARYQGILIEGLGYQGDDENFYSTALSSCASASLWFREK